MRRKTVDVQVGVHTVRVPARRRQFKDEIVLRNDLLFFLSL
jgi:hypothetical protein